MKTNPIWYHVDVNSAFLSWSAAYRVHVMGEDADLRNVPSVVGGSAKDRHGIVLAKSVPAGRYGIRTGETLWEAGRKCPGLKVIPPDYELYVRCSRSLMTLLEQYSGDIHPYSIDEAFMDMSGSLGLVGSPVVFAHQLKDEILNTLGFTVNIGVSSGKLLAKMASELQKPDRVHTLFPEELPAKLWGLPVSELFMVGRAAAKKLSALGIHTIGELAQTPPELLRAHLKKHGEVIWQYANGIDESPFLQKQEENKGYGNSVTTSFDIADMETARQVLLSLTETVCARLRADGKKAALVGVSAVDRDFRRYSRQTALVSPTGTTEEIYRAACRIFEGAWDGAPVRQLGVFTGKISCGTAYQYNLFDRDKYDRFSRLNAAVDEIRSQYGEDAVMRAVFLKSPIPHMSGGIDKAKRTGITRPLPG